MTQGFPFQPATGEFVPLWRAQSSVTKPSLAVKLSPLTLKWALGAQIVSTCKRSFAISFIWKGKPWCQRSLFCGRLDWFCHVNVRYLIHANHFQSMAHLCWPTKPRRKVFIPSTDRVSRMMFFCSGFLEAWYWASTLFVCAFFVCPFWICNEHGFMLYGFVSLVWYRLACSHRPDNLVNGPFLFHRGSYKPLFSDLVSWSLLWSGELRYRIVVHREACRWLLVENRVSVCLFNWFSAGCCCFCCECWCRG